MADVDKTKDIDLSKIPSSILTRLTGIVDFLQRFKLDKIEIDSEVHKEFVANVSPRTVTVIREYSCLPAILKVEDSKQTALVNDLLDKASSLLKEIYRAGLSKQTVTFDAAVETFEEFLASTIVEED
jgi:hypothetical protein